jgi:hypothetical protein
MTVRVYVNRFIIESNSRTGKNDPPLAIKRKGRPVKHGHCVKLQGDAALIYDPSQTAGARVWIEADDAHIITNEGRSLKTLCSAPK